MAISEDKKKLFDLVRAKFGAPIRSVELTDEQLCNLLEIAIGNYAEKIQNFIIENNWAQLYGRKFTNITSQDMAFAMSVRSLHMGNQFAQWFSKETTFDVQQRGPWELKKDFFMIEEGKQVYQIPAGREISRVLWVTPPTTDAATWGAYGGLGVNMGSNVNAQMGLGATSIFGGMGGGYGMGAGTWAVQAIDVWMHAIDFSNKNQLFGGDLMFKVTAGPDGTHLIHLMSTPGSRIKWGAGRNQLSGCTCWYTYYDVSGQDAEDCLRENADTIILSPDQVPLDKLDFMQLNSPTQQIVRQLLLAEAAETLAFVRGKFSGDINMINSALKMDYGILLSYGQREKDKAMDELKARLERLSPYYQMEKQAKLVQDTKDALKGVPLGIYMK